MTANPLVGSWLANLAKSRRHPNHLFQSATLVFEVAGNDVTLSHGGVNAGGQPESGTAMFQADGVERPVPGQAAVTVVARWNGPGVLEINAKREGTPIGGSSYAVSPDGTTLTATVSGIDAAGALFDQVIVFDRKS